MDLKGKRLAAGPGLGLRAGPGSEAGWVWGWVGGLSTHLCCAGAVAGFWRSGLWLERVGKLLWLCVQAAGLCGLERWSCGLGAGSNLVAGALLSYC